MREVAMQAALAAVLALCAVSGLGAPFSRTIPLSDPWAFRFMDAALLRNGSIACSMAMVMEDPELVLLDSEGEVLKELDGLSVPGRALESGGWIVPREGGGLFLVAFSEPRATGMDTDIALFGISPSLEVEWREQIGADTDIVYRGLAATGTSDGGCVIAGTTGYGEEGYFIRRYADDGTLSWEQTVPGGKYAWPSAMGGMSSGVLLLLPHEWDEITFLQLLGNDGTPRWSLEIPYACGGGPAAFRETSDGFSVYFSSYGDREVGTIVEVGHNGVLDEAMVFEHGMDARDALIEEDGTLVLAGARTVDGEQGAALEAWTPRGEMIWRRIMDGPGEDCFDRICSLDEGYCLLGSSMPGPGEEEGWSLMVITGADGIVPGGADESVIPFP
jgi:hypothetical protein